MKSKVFKLFAILLVLTMLIGTVPVSAKEKKVEVKTKTGLLNAIKAKKAAKIVFNTKKAVKVTIPAGDTAANKTLIVKAPKAKITNKAVFKSIELKSASTFTEAAKGNTVTVSGKVKKFTDKSAKLTLKAGSSAETQLTIAKKTNLEITGNKKANIDVINKAKDSKITASIPVELEAGVKTNLTLLKGSEGSVVNSVDNASIKVTNKSSQAPTIEHNGVVDTTPTVTPTPTPTGSDSKVTPVPTPTSSVQPTGTIQPTGAIVVELPTEKPTQVVTQGPTQNPTKVPTQAPTQNPTKVPTQAPTQNPTKVPTQAPTQNPTKTPTQNPTKAPTQAPTQNPTKAPTQAPTQNPTKGPTQTPTQNPTKTPTQAPTQNPTKVPTEKPTSTPISTPTEKPTSTPISTPTEKPTSTPISTPTEKPTSTPISTPTEKPTSTPISTPTEKPTSTPISTPTEKPTSTPISTPTEKPTSTPISTPTEKPTSTPISTPTEKPTSTPISTPTEKPTSTPTSTPTEAPTSTPTSTPTPSGNTTAIKVTYNQAEAREMLTLINNYRAANGSNADSQRALVYDYNLEKAAMQRAAETSVLQDAYTRPDGKSYKQTLADNGFNISGSRGNAYRYEQLFTFDESGSLNSMSAAFDRFVADSSLRDIILAYGTSAAIGHVTIEKKDYWVVYVSNAPNTSSYTPAASGESTVYVKIQ